MDEQTRVLEYKCPCCGAGLHFGDGTQKLTCEYCGNSFEIEAIRAYNEDRNQPSDEKFQWENEQQQTAFSEEEENALRAFQCPSCGGEIISDENTVATFCPYCDNPTIMPSRLSGSLKPDGVIPFKTGKEDAKAAFLRLCKGKPLLPKGFTAEQRLEKITGMYVPFWLYDCSADFSGSYQATRVHKWSDSEYQYTKTDHYLLKRDASADFGGIPMDGSSKMEDAFMESIEPYDYTQLESFDMAYLTGYLADKYDVPSENGETRVRQRVDAAMDDKLQSTFIGYATVSPTSRQLNVRHSKARYVLMPVWILNTRYRDKIYTFAMNGQTGKMTGSFPICPVKTAAWFFGVAAVTALLTSVVQFFIF